MIGDDQISMFGPRARTSDPGTSHAAARSMEKPADVQRAKILAALVRPMTADELDESLGLRPTSAGRRLPELREMGLVRELKATRPTRSGRQAHVYALSTEAA